MLFGLATLVFFLSRLLPGDPSSLFLSPEIPPSVAGQLKSQFGLDRPLFIQYVSWLEAIGKGELGYSFAHGMPVAEVLLRVFPNTAILALSALLVEVVLAVSVVGLAVAHVGSTVDRILERLTLLVYSLPSFWIGILLLLIFSFSLRMFPSSQMYSSGTGGAGEFTSLTDLFAHLVLPTLTVALPGSALLARYLRSAVTETLSQEYLLAARAMGLSNMKLFGLYILPNSFGPVVSVLGIEVGVLLTGVLVTETLFSWPGMGRIAVMAIFTRDYPMILGCTLLGGVVVVLANVGADLLRAVIDPRVRMSS